MAYVKLTCQQFSPQPKPIKAEKKKVFKKQVEKTDKQALQDEINKLARMIDVYFGFDTCIDCGKHMDKSKNQIDACHFIGRGSNSTLKYNLLILHSGHNHCNVWNQRHEINYRDNLIKRYGSDFLTTIEALPLKYPEIHLSNFEITEKLKIVKVLIRTFGSHRLSDPISARNLFNNIIGIYKK